MGDYELRFVVKEDGGTIARFLTAADARAFIDEVGNPKMRLSEEGSGDAKTRDRTEAA